MKNLIKDYNSNIQVFCDTTYHILPSKSICSYLINKYFKRTIFNLFYKK